MMRLGVSLFLALALALLGATGLSKEKKKDKADKVKTLAEEVATAKKQARESQMLFDSILEQKQAATKAKDPKRLKCVLDIATACEGLLRICEKALPVLLDAYECKDRVAVGHEAVKIDVAHQKIAKLSAEADICGDDMRNYDGPTVIEIEEPKED